MRPFNCLSFVDETKLLKTHGRGRLKAPIVYCSLCTELLFSSSFRSSFSDHPRFRPHSTFSLPSHVSSSPSCSSSSCLLCFTSQTLCKTSPPSPPLTSVYITNASRETFTPLRFSAFIILPPLPSKFIIYLLVFFRFSSVFSVVGVRAQVLLQFQNLSNNLIIVERREKKEKVAIEEVED